MTLHSHSLSLSDPTVGWRYVRSVCVIKSLRFHPDKRLIIKANETNRGKNRGGEGDVVGQNTLNSFSSAGVP